MTHNQVGLFTTSAAMALCGAGLVAIVCAAAPSPLDAGVPHFLDWAMILGTGMMALCIGAGGMIVAAASRN